MQTGAAKTVEQNAPEAGRTEAPAPVNDLRQQSRQARAVLRDARKDFLAKEIGKEQYRQVRQKAVDTVMKRISSNLQRHKDQLENHWKSLAEADQGSHEENRAKEKIVATKKRIGSLTRSLMLSQPK